jgi:hypothetical protein
MPPAFAREMVADLDERDRDYLHECSINDEVIDSRPYLTLTDQLKEELVEEWGFHPGAW